MCKCVSNKYIYIYIRSYSLLYKYFYTEHLFSDTNKRHRSKVPEPKRILHTLPVLGLRYCPIRQNPTLAKCYSKVCVLVPCHAPLTIVSTAGLTSTLKILPVSRICRCSLQQNHSPPLVGSFLASLFCCSISSPLLHATV